MDFVNGKTTNAESDNVLMPPKIQLFLNHVGSSVQRKYVLQMVLNVSTLPIAVPMAKTIANWEQMDIVLMMIPTHCADL